MDLSVEYTNKVLGLHLTARQISQLLVKAGFEVKEAGCDVLAIEVPCYRIDVMHPVDLIEDVAIAYGYNNIAPLWRELPTTGGVRLEQHLLDIARELMVGLGFQEILTCTMTNPDNLFTRMRLKKEQIIEIVNPKVQTLTCLRNWLLPSLMEFLSNNQSVEYPQKIFELGKVTLLDAKKETKTRDEEFLAAAISHANAGFTEIKSALAAFFTGLGLEWQIKEMRHPSFIEGRVGAATINGADVGFLGEIHPKVLNAWKIEYPVSAFQIRMEKIIEVKQGFTR
jgi:phenylalanyl-tRNA synthetase beta chain